MCFVLDRMHKKVTLSIESSIYDKYKKYCEENAIMLSKKIELMMKKELDNGQEGKNEK
jgi:hypothetical protein